MGDRTNRKVVKYRKVYKVVIEGKADTTSPNEEPFALRFSRDTLLGVVAALDTQRKWNSVKVTEITE